MTLPTQTSLSLSQIQTEFGGSNPISLSEYYAGGAYVPVNTVGFPGAIPDATGPFSAVAIPSSGTISIANFFGSGALFTYTISASTNDVNITGSAMQTAGWDGSQRVRVKINSGVTVSATTTTTAALRLSGSFPSGVEIYNEGSIIGRGGNGGGGASVDGLLWQFVNATAGSAGGAAIAISSYTGPTVAISNYANIRGGGGGGGGGSSNGTTEAGPKNTTITYARGGGGGGGGRSSSTSSSGGSGGAATRANYISSGSAGGSGTTSAAGTGGNGGSVFSTYYGGNGGNGGGYGATGSTGGTGTATKYGSEAAGGSGGAAVTGYASASLTNYGAGAYSGSLVS